MTLGEVSSSLEKKKKKIPELVCAGLRSVIQIEEISDLAANKIKMPTKSPLKKKKKHLNHPSNNWKNKKETGNQAKKKRIYNRNNQNEGNKNQVQRSRSPETPPAKLPWRSINTVRINKNSPLNPYQPLPNRPIRNPHQVYYLPERLLLLPKLKRHTRPLRPFW